MNLSYYIYIFNTVKYVSIPTSSMFLHHANKNDTFIQRDWSKQLSKFSVLPEVL